MGAVILRSVLCGIAAIVAALFAIPFLFVIYAVYFGWRHPPPEGGGSGEIGWDVVTLAHNLSPTWILLPLSVFAVGFALGFRHFSKSLKQNRSGSLAR